MTRHDMQPLVDDTRATEAEAPVDGAVIEQSVHAAHDRFERKVAEGGPDAAGPVHHLGRADIRGIVRALEPGRLPPVERRQRGAGRYGQRWYGGRGKSLMIDVRGEPALNTSYQVCLRTQAWRTERSAMCLHRSHGDHVHVCPLEVEGLQNLGKRNDVRIRRTAGGGESEAGVHAVTVGRVRGGASVHRRELDFEPT